MFLSIKIFPQENSFSSNMILFDYNYQIPVTGISDYFGPNSSIGLGFLQNNNDFLIGADVNFMFGDNIKNDSIFSLISTEGGFLINSSGELDQVLLYERGYNTHVLFGRSIRMEENHLSGIYVYFGLGYLQYKIKLETDKTTLPQIDDDYIKGYDQFTNGLSSKLCLDYMYFDKRNSIKFHVGLDLINALTVNRRLYNFSEMTTIDNRIKLDQLVSLRFGIIIPINRNNESRFHYY